jgi:hypothetical protein
MLAIAAAGALVAGLYGAIHDQITFAISPEYFTRLKFRQFRWADMGLPPRLFAAIVGFLASAGAGLIAGWFLARAGLDQVAPPNRRRLAIRAFAIVLAAAIAAGSLGAAIGSFDAEVNASSWNGWRDRLDLHDPAGFAIVAWIHASGYIGALVGLIAAMLYIRRSPSATLQASNPENHRE